MGAQRRDPQASPVQGVVREDFQEEVDSELHPEGRLGMSRWEEEEGRAVRESRGNKGTKTVCSVAWWTNRSADAGVSALLVLTRAGTALGFTNNYLFTKSHSCPKR